MTTLVEKITVGKHWKNITSDFKILLILFEIDRRNLVNRWKSWDIIFILPKPFSPSVD